MLPALCDDQRFILGLVSGAASVIFGLVMLDVGPSILYFLTRKGEPPRRPHPLMWALCGVSGLIALVVPSVTGAAPSQVCSNIKIAAFECAPAGPDLQGEYVELVNRGNTGESLNG